MDQGTSGEEDYVGSPSRGQFQRLLRICFVAFLVYTLIHYFGGHPKAAVIHLLATILTGLVWMLGTMQPNYLALAGHLNLAVATAALSAHSWNGALLNDSAWFLALIPLFAAYLLDWRAAVTWTGILTVILIGMPILAKRYHPVPEWILDQPEVYRNRVLLVWLVAVLAVAAARSLRNEITRSRAQSKRIEEINHRLHQVNHVLEQKNTDIELFASAASHDLRAPLRRSRLFLDMIKREQAENFSEEAKEWFGHADAQIDLMQRLVTDLFDYASLESGLSDPEPVCTGEILKKIQESLEQPSALVLPASLPTLYSHSTLLSQLFTNLVQNGLKYNISDTPQVEVKVHKDNDIWSFVFEDNGIGIEAKNLERIFEPFHRLHGSEEYAGSGLGLALCLRVAQLLNGEIWAESEPGVGSRFVVTVPDEQSNPKS